MDPGLGHVDPSAVLDVETIRRLHALACIGIYDFGGQFRSGPVYISGTGHIPPPAEEVVDHVDEMVRYVNTHWEASPVNLCSYILWRCNWIHPFPNANGRTTRGFAYLTFLLRLGFEPGGVPTFMDVIADDKQPYYAALDHADAQWSRGVLDVSAMETVVTELLIRQLRS